MKSNLLKKAKFGLNIAASRPKGWKSVLYNTIMASLKIPGPLMMPAHISIEPTNQCNAKCPICETGNKSLDRPFGKMDELKFRKFINENANTTAVIMFYFMGEPFLHPNAYEMIRFARSRNIYVEACTNGEQIDPYSIISSDINLISFQIGGLTKETHGIYRRNTDFDIILNNLEELIRLRNETPESNVKIEIGFIVMKHNEHEVEGFYSWARSLGVDKINVIDPCVRNIEEGKIYLPEDQKYWFYDYDLFQKGVLKPIKAMHNECPWIWNSITINWDGSVVPCCRDAHGREMMGNVFEQPIKEIWNGKRMTEFRNKIVTNQKSIQICRLCSGFGIPNLQTEYPVKVSGPDEYKAKNLKNI